jgi:hypothetical protein
MKPHLAREMENCDKDFQMIKKMLLQRGASLGYLEKSISFAEIL